jgi:hypothetical protein
MQATGFNFNSLFLINVLFGALSLVAFGCGDRAVTELNPDSDFGNNGTGAGLSMMVPAAERGLRRGRQNSGRAVAEISDSNPCIR